MSRRTGKRTVILILLWSGVLLIAALGSLFIISGIFKFPKYLEPWQKTYAQKFDDPRIRLAAHGLLAANGHNMQPWKIRLDKDNPMVFYLYADGERLTNEADPFARQMMITQGTFLEYVKIAGDELGYKAAVELFPEGSYDGQKLTESMETRPVAKIMLTKDRPQSNPLYGSMFLPDTNRLPYQPTRLTAEQINKLEAINTDAHMTLKIFQDKENIEKLASYAIKGAIAEAGVGHVMQEQANIFRANEYKKNKYRYGFSVEGQGTTGLMQHLMQGVVTLFPSLNSGKGASDLFVQSTRTSVDSTLTYAMIITEDNNRSSQVESGMLYSRLVLTAHSLGVVMQPLSQVLEEYPEMEELYNSIHLEYASDGGTIQMFSRLGVPTKEVSQSMRRDVMDLLAED